jgi:hypothetical protein
MGTGGEMILLPITKVIASVTPEPEHSPEKTIDGKGYFQGDPDSRWAGQPIPEWICFDLGATKIVKMTKLEFYNWHGGRIYEYSINVSIDNVSWNTVVSHSNSSLAEWTTDEFDQVTARYVKIDYHGQNQNNWAGLWEAQIWGDNLTTFENPSDLIVDEFSISQNYPNPFNPSTKIKIRIPIKTHVNLKIYNSIGEEISELANYEMESGIHEFEFNADDLTSGIYFYRMIAQEFIDTKKMILLR